MSETPIQVGPEFVNSDKFNPMNDVFFKFMLGKEQNVRHTISFLNSLLGEELGRKIESVRFDPSETSPEAVGGKGARFDVACTLDDKERVDIEVQIANQSNMARRSQFYLSRLFSSQMKEGQGYKRLSPAIVICLVDFDLFDDEAPVSFWQMRNPKTNQRLNNDLCIVFVEMPKVAKKSEATKKLTKGEIWSCFFCRDLSAKKRKEVVMSCPDVADAYGTAGLFFADTAIAKHYFDQEILRMDEEDRIETAEMRGAQGVVLGMLENKLPLGVICSSSKMSPETVRELAAKHGLSVCEGGA